MMGAYKTDIGYVLTSIKVITPDLKIKTMYNNNFLKQNKKLWVWDEFYEKGLSNKKIADNTI